MTKTLGMYFGEKKLRKIAHRCDNLLVSGRVTAHYAWYGTSTGGDAEVWKEYIQNFLNTYKHEYGAGYHHMVAVATLLSLADVYGIDKDDYCGEDQFKCTLNRGCQMGKAGDYEYVPICKIEEGALIARALKKPAFKNKFTVKVKCCKEADGDPRTALYIRERGIDYRI